MRRRLKCVRLRLDVYRSDSRTDPARGKLMIKLIGRLAACVIAAGASTSSQAQNSVRIGLILPYSGQFADFATQLDNGIKLYIKENGATIAGKTVEIIRKD